MGTPCEVARLVRVSQGHHGATVPCRPGGGEAWRLERIAERGEATVRQALALEGVAHGGEPVPIAQPHEGREVHLARDGLWLEVRGGGTADAVSMGADQRPLGMLERVEVSGQGTGGAREPTPAVEGSGQRARPVLQGHVPLASIPFGQGHAKAGEPLFEAR